MRRRILTLSAVMFLLLQGLPAFPETGPAVILTTGQPPGPSARASRRVFPDDTGEIRVHAVLPGGEKKKVGFIWYGPSGEVFSQTYNIIFPQKGKEVLDGWDRLKVAGNPPSERPGWWRVEVVFDDKKLSKSFLLTKNRLAQVIDTGDKAEKTGYLKGIKPDSPDLKDVVSLALEDDEPEVRACAIRLLAGRSDGWAIKALAAGQEDPSPLVRTASLDILSSLGGDKGRSAVERAASDPSPVVRNALVSSLKGRDQAEVSGLLGRLIKDPDSGVRMKALSILSGMEGEGTFAAIVGGLSVEDRNFRIEVVVTLIKKSGPGRTSALAAALKDPDQDIRFTALKELAAVGSPEALKAVRPLSDDPALLVAQTAFDTIIAINDTEGLATAVKSRHLEIRRLAVDALSASHDPARVKGLAAALEDGDAGLRMAAVRGLQRAGTDGIPGILAALKDPDPGIREEAAGTLSTLGVGDAAVGMMAALSDPHEPVRADALKYFIGRGGPSLPGIIEKTACDKSRDIRALGFNALARSPGEGSSRAMSVYLSCGDPALKSDVVATLADRDDRAAIEAMKSVLKDEDASIRLAAATSLLGHGIKAPLIGLADDPDPKLKGVALSAMLGAPDRGMLPALSVLLKEKDARIRLRVIEVARLIPGDPAGEMISSAVDDSSAEVREEARAVLLRRRDDGAVPGLAIMAKGADEQTRKAALDALRESPGQKADDALYGVYSSVGPEAKVEVLNRIAARGPGLLGRALVPAIAGPDIKLRSIAMGLVVRLPDREAREIYKTSLSSMYPDVREAGLSSLISLNDPALFEFLPSLAKDADPRIAVMAVGAARGLPDARKKVEIYLAASVSPDNGVALAALEGLLPFGDARALPVFERFFRANDLREDILAAMAKVPGDAPIGSLAMAYHELPKDDVLRVQAVRSLAGRGAGTAGLLKEAMGDQSVNVRREAVKAALSLSAADYVPVLGMALKDTDSGVKEQAFAVLGSTEGIASSRQILTALDDTGLRDRALAILRARRGKETLEALDDYSGGIKDQVFRAKVVVALAEDGLEETQLVKFLKDKLPEVRLAALAALRKAGGEPVTKGILSVITDDVPAVRRVAAEALSGREGPEAVYGLLLAGADPDPSVSDLAVKGLSGRRTGLKEAVLLVFLRNQAAPGVLAFAASNIRDESALQSLVDGVPANDTDRLRALLSPLMERHEPFDLQALLDGFKTEDRPLKEGLALAVARVKAPDTGAALAGLYNRFPELRSVVTRAAGDEGHADMVLPLALKDDLAIRRVAAGYFKTLSGGPAEEILPQALKDPDESVRMAAARAASPSGDEKLRRAAAEAYAGLILSSDATVSDEALRSLEYLGDKAPSSVWHALAGDTRVGKPVRLAALAALTKRKDPGSAQLFAGFLISPDPELGKAAEDGVRAIGAASLPALHPLLSDDSLRPLVLRIIKDIGDPSSEGPILSVLPRMSGQERIAGVSTLGVLGGPHSVDMLSSLYKTGDAAMRGAVVKAFGGMRLTGDEPGLIEVLSDALASKDDGVRFYAAHTVGTLKVIKLKEAVETAIRSEHSPVIKDELVRALGTLTSL